MLFLPVSHIQKLASYREQTKSLLKTKDGKVLVQKYVEYYATGFRSNALRVALDAARYLFVEWHSKNMNCHKYR